MQEIHFCIKHSGFTNTSLEKTPLINPPSFKDSFK